ncbi:MAG: ribonuclease T [Gammaproteobacteria bacterium]|nr:ribonuclease T [Gammaproteobacteria bacterium]
MKNRFRGFYPVVVDVETGGFNSETDALLEIAAVTLGIDKNFQLQRMETIRYHVEPFEGANIEQSALDFTGIQLDHPLRMAVSEREALDKIFKVIRAEKKLLECKRAVLVGHNSWFDLGFLNAAVERVKHKRNPFHPFTSFDTATLGGVVYGQTVLSRACEAAKIPYDNDKAHSAAYDAEVTADLFCAIANQNNGFRDYSR